MSDESSLEKMYQTHRYLHSKVNQMQKLAPKNVKKRTKKKLGKIEERSVTTPSSHGDSWNNEDVKKTNLQPRVTAKRYDRFDSCESNPNKNASKYQRDDSTLCRVEAKLKRLDAALEAIFRRFKLHEDNIDEIQERLYINEFGTPGTVAWNFRFYSSLIKCLVLPIVAVEILYFIFFFKTP